MSDDLREQLEKMDHLSLVGEYLRLLEQGEDRSKLLKENHDLLKENELLKRELRVLQELHELKTALRFKPSSEQTELLFDEAELLSLPVAEPRPETVVVKEHERKKPQQLTTLPANTPVVTIEHDSEAPSCERCGSETVRIGDKVVDKVGVQPKRYYIERHLYHQYSCGHCEADHDEGEKNVLTAWEHKETDSIIAAASLVAQTAVQKYADALPLYRQEAIFSREGFEVSRQTLSNWLIRYASLLEPLSRRLRKQLLSSALINQDETPIQVLHFPDAKPSATHFMFVQVGTSSVGGKLHRVVRYTFLGDRRNETLAAQVEGYDGYVMTDGLKGYLKLSRHLNCWVHAQRPFKEILKANPKAAGAAKIVAMTNKLYVIEKEYRLRFGDPDQFLAERKRRCQEVFSELRKHIEAERDTYTPKSPMGKAIAYLFTYWDTLVAYVDCFEASPDNNIAENAIRPFTLGRKNWLFSNTEGGVNASALYYSLIETAKANGINVFDYLWHCLFTAPACRSDEDWDALLPWNVDQQQIAALKVLRDSAKPDPGRTEPYVLRGKR